jgi:molybdopterin converting factor small subunit
VKGEPKPEARRADPEIRLSGAKLGEPKPEARRAPTLAATIEITTWVTRYVGGDGSGGARIFEESFAPGETVRDVLRRYTSRIPDLDAALWNPARTDLGEHIEVLVNDAVLGVTHDLDTELQGGERITLLGQFMGG